MKKFVLESVRIETLQYFSQDPREILGIQVWMVYLEAQGDRDHLVLKVHQGYQGLMERR